MDFFFKYLGVYLNKKLNWSYNTDALYKKGESRLHLLRRLRSFGVSSAFLRTFYDTVVVSAVFYALMCWRGSGTKRNRKRLDKLVKEAGSSDIHQKQLLPPLHHIVEALGSPSRLILSAGRRSLGGHTARSFLPTATRLINVSF